MTSPISQAEILIDYYRSIIPEPEAMLACLQQPLPTALSVNTLKVTTERCQQLLQEVGVSTETMTWNPNGLKAKGKIDGIGLNWAYQAGLYQTQEEVSLLPAIVLDPQPGEKVLDLCAAPGGKTVQMAVMMQNTGTLIANDRNYGRLRAVGHMIKRLGLFNVATTALDGSAYPALRNHFDRVLVDAPCGCEGTWRKSSKKAVLPNRKNSLSISEIQYRLLEKAMQLTRVGGRIVYSTCTFAPEENEAVVSRLLQEHGDKMSILPIKIEHWKASPGVTAWQGDTYHPDVRQSLRVWPHQNNSGGFFVALLEKTDDKQQKAVTVRDEIRCNDPTIAPVIEQVLSRFGITTDIFDGYSANANNHRGIYLSPPSLQVPENLPVDAAGLFAIKTKTKHAKLSTPAAMWITPLAKKNCIELNENQRDLYLLRQTIFLNEKQVNDIDSTGYVLVTYRGVGLGVGLYLQYQDGPAQLKSMFPKAL